MTKAWRHEAPLEAKVLGEWETLAREKIYGAGSKKYSSFDLMLRRMYKRAMNGEIPAVRFILGRLDANIAARDHLYPVKRHVEIWRGGSPPRPTPKEAPRNADMALMLLGIAGVRNGRLAQLRADHERTYDEKLRDLRPNVLEPWVREFARQAAATGEPARDPQVSSSGIGITEVPPEMRDWHADRDRLLGDLMRIHGPGASRFKPGQSGNPKGRPRAQALYPYDDFFMEIIRFKIGKKTYRFTRLDALMRQLEVKAAQGDDKLLDLIAPRLAKLEEQAWQRRNIVERPRIIRQDSKRRRKTDEYL